MFHVYRGLLDTLNEMRYANPANPLDREPARHAVQNNVRPVPIDNNLGYIESQNPRDQAEGEDANQNAPPPDLNGNNLVPPPQQFRDDEDDENDENLQDRGHAEQHRIQV